MQLLNITSDKNLIFELLPLEIISLILIFLNPLDIVQFCQVCKYLNMICNNENIWEKKILQLNIPISTKEPRGLFQIIKKQKGIKYVTIWFYLSLKKIFQENEIRKGLGTFFWKNSCYYVGEWKVLKKYLLFLLYIYIFLE